MSDESRSGCPINLTLEVLGDKWSLLVLRDMMFGNQRHFRDLLNNSMEGIASNILADRLKRLTAEGLLTRAGDPTHRQKAIYSLTERAIELVPLFAHLGAWGRKQSAASPELSIRAELLEKGGAKLWARFMDELRHLHLGAPKPRGTSVLDELTAAYERVKAQRLVAGGV